MPEYDDLIAKYILAAALEDQGLAQPPSATSSRGSGRNEPVSLQYSPQEEFTLPENLFLIGTMNTVDRSIARIGTAMAPPLRLH